MRSNTEMRAATLDAVHTLSRHEAVAYPTVEGEPYEIQLAVEPAAPHRIAGLRVSPVHPKVEGWDELLADLRALDHIESSLDPSVAERSTTARDETRIPGMGA